MLAPNLTGHTPAHRGAGTAIALFFVAALIACAQALAPAPAAAMVNMGEECDPLTTIDCEPTNGGGGGGPVGTTTGGGAGNGEIVGEAIYVEGTLPPSPCRPSSCLPSQIGGGPTGFLDRGGKDPRGPRPRGRATRVGEIAKGKTIARGECQQLATGQGELHTPATDAALAAVRGYERGNTRLRNALAKRETLSRQLNALFEERRVASAEQNSNSARLSALNRRISKVFDAVDAVERDPTMVEWGRLVDKLNEVADAEFAAANKKCKALYDISWQ